MFQSQNPAGFTESTKTPHTPGATTLTPTLNSDQQTDVFLFQATQVLDRATKLAGFVDNFKFELGEYVKGLQSIQKNQNEIGEKIGALDVRDHREFQSMLGLTYTALGQTNSQNVIMQERLQRIINSDLDTFDKSWKLIKSYTNQYVKATKKAAKKRTTTNRNDKIKEIRENRGVKKKVYEGMSDMRTIFEEFIHTQLFYHSKCLELWGAVWEEASENFKAEKVRKKEEEEEEEERLNELLKETKIN